MTRPRSWVYTTKDRITYTVYNKDGDKLLVTDNKKDVELYMSVEASFRDIAAIEDNSTDTLDGKSATIPVTVTKTRYMCNTESPK